jgi:uncharacterized membrane protein HdeD (DUF308 family)
MHSLSRNWWLVALRGLLLVLFGLAALTRPGITLTVLALWVGAGFLVNGAFALGAAIVGHDVEGRGWLALEGVLGVVAGFVTFVYPGLTQLVLLWMLAGWAILSGFTEIAAAVQFRRVISNEWMLGLVGALSVAFGVLLIARPFAGLLTLALLIGWFAILYGAALIAFGVRLRNLRSWLGDDAGGLSARL